MESELSSVRELLADLCEGAKPPSPARLMCLSGLGAAEMAALREGWPRVGSQRQREVVAQLVSLALENVDLDFAAVFRLGLAVPDEEVRLQSIAGLWESEDYSLIDPMVRMLESDISERVRAAAAGQLGQLGLLAELGKLQPGHGRRVQQALLRVLESGAEKPLVRARALEAFAVFRSPRVAEFIRRAAGSGHPAERKGALVAMGRTCDPAWLPELIKAMSSAEADVRAVAAAAAGELGLEEAVPNLVRLTKDESVEVREAAIGGLGEIGGEVAKRVLEQLSRSTTKRVRDAAQAALADLVFWEDPAAVRGPEY